MTPKRKRKYTFKKERCSPSAENNFTNQIVYIN